MLISTLNAHVEIQNHRDLIIEITTKFQLDVQETKSFMNDNIPFYSEKVFKYANEICEIEESIGPGLWAADKANSKQLKEFKKAINRIYHLIGEIEKAMREQFDTGEVNHDKTKKIRTGRGRK